MPNIREYQNENNVNPGPLEGTAFSLERYGRITQESIQQGAAGLAQVAHEIEQHEAKNDASNLIAAHAQIDAGLFKAYREKAQDPNAPENWREDFFQNTVVNAYDKLKASAKTPSGYSHAEDLGAQGQYNWTRTIAADQAKEDGEKHIAAINASVQTSANLANESPDQRAGEIAKNVINIRALVPAAHQEAAIQQMTAAITDSALAGVVSLAQKNPTISAEAVEGLKSYINDPQNKFTENSTRGAFARANDDLQTLVNDAPERLRRAENAKAADAARVAKANNETATDELQKRLIGPNGNTTLSVSQVMADAIKDDRFTPEGREGIIKFADYLNNEELRRTKAEETAQTDPKVWDNLFSRAQLDPHDPHFLTMADIVAAGHGRVISRDDAVRLAETMRATAADKPYRQGLAQVKSFLAQEAKQPGFSIADPITGIKDATAVDRLNGFRAAVQDRFDQVYHSGGDWRTLFDSNSPNYLGNMRDPYLPGAKLFGQQPANLDNLNRDMPLPAIRGEGQSFESYYDGVKAGQSYVAPDGKIRTKGGK